jgi:hypothetical protein
MKSIRGLGDLVAIVLKPLEWVLRHFGVNVGSQSPLARTVSNEVVVGNPPISQNTGCGCQKRKDFLNKIVPNPLAKN